LGVSPDSFDFTKDYLSYISLGTPFILFASTFQHVLRGEGAAKASMIGGLVGTVTNIILDPILILGLHMNTAGAAIATVIGNILACVYYLWYFKKKQTPLSLHPKHLRVCKGIVKDVLKLGLPAGANAALSGVAMMLLMRFLAKYGDISIAAMGIVIRANMLIDMIAAGMANGILPLLGYNYGANNIPRFKKILKFSFILACSVSVAISLCYLVFAKDLIRLFIDNAEVISQGVPMLIIYALSGLVYSIVFFSVSSLQALKRSLPATIISLCRQGILFIPLLFLMNSVFGFNGIISVQTVSNYLSAVVAVVLLWRAFKTMRAT
jgi:putative MATE family efflux protein